MSDFDVLGKITVNDEGAQGALDSLVGAIHGAGIEGGIAAGVVGLLGQAFEGILTEGAKLAEEAISAVTEAIQQSVEAAMNMQVIQTTLAAVLANTGKISGITVDEVNGVADSLSGATMNSKEAVLQASELMVKYSTISKSTFPQAMQAAADLAAVMGESLPSAASQLSRALGSPELATRMLRLAGIDLSAQQKQQIKLWDLYGQTGKSQALILKLITDHLGGTADKLGQTAEGQLTIFNNKVAEVKETIGEGFLPALTQVGTDLLTKLLPAIQQLIPVLTPLFVSFGNILTSDIIPILETHLIPALEGLKEPFIIIDGLMTHIGKGDFAGALAILSFAFGGLGPQIATVKSWLDAMMPAWNSLQVVFTMLAPIFQKIGAIFMQEFNKIVQWFEKNRPLIGSFVNEIVQVFGYIAVGAANLIVALSPILDAILQLILGVVKTLMQIATGDWAGAWLTLKQTGAVILLDIITAINNFFNWILAYFGTNLDELDQVWANNWAALVIIVTNWWNTVKAKLAAFLVDAKAWGLNLIKAIGQGIASGANDIFKALKAVLAKAIADAIAWLEKSGTKSPLMWDVSYKLMTDLGEGISHGVSIPVRAMIQGMDTLAMAATNPGTYGASSTYNSTVNSGGNFNNMGVVMIQLGGANPNMNDFLDSVRRINQ